jgi:type I restriction enzyme M protein
MKQDNTVQKIWNLCNVLRGDGIGYNEYISELTYLLFLKVAKETKTESLLPKDCRWNDLVSYNGDNLLGHYQEMLTKLGNKAKDENVKKIFAFPTTVFNHSENLKVVIDGIDNINWHSFSQDGIGDIYEGLLSKNSEDSRSGAGQYFTPRSLVDAIIQVVKPDLGEVIQDPASGTGGFLISADKYIRDNCNAQAYKKSPPHYEGIEIEKGTFRLCLMNTFLHEMDAQITLGDALTADASILKEAGLIIANPPFGSKSGSVRNKRDDIKFPSSNKQLDFLQHIYNGLKYGGRAAVVLPDNVLFEGNVGKKIREDLMHKCNLHTILRLPTGIFYAQGVKTNVLFFTKGAAKKGKNQTQNTWVYDMRANMPQFGKRTPFTFDYFTDFIKAYGDDPHGTSKRKDTGEQGRFRCFSREFIAERGDSLDISWLKDESNGSHEDLPEPDELAASAIAELEGAVGDLNTILELLSTEEAA